MKMPGFYAEVPLNAGGGPQYSGAMQGGSATVQGVVPQLPLEFLHLRLSIEYFS
jgi:hypothetical protein